VGMVPGRQDVLRPKLDLEGRDAVDGSCGGPDLRGEVREGRQVVAEDRCGIGESIPGQLHSITGIASEPYDDPFLLFDALGHAWDEPQLLRARFLLRIRGLPLGYRVHTRVTAIPLGCRPM